MEKASGEVGGWLITLHVQGCYTIRGIRRGSKGTMRRDFVKGVKYKLVSVSW
jgi:hypothetical protein